MKGNYKYTEQAVTANKGWSSSFGIWQGLTSSYFKKLTCNKVPWVWLDTLEWFQNYSMSKKKVRIMDVNDAYQEETELLSMCTTTWGLVGYLDYVMSITTKGTERGSILK
jgi:hypothetical protein